ncbi:MAG: rhomboid family intramembrane serine protease [Coriobacteriia bacterium]|nr:rhomboid family intramembrane serine protease [Coriobacteriia bacterium]
MFFFPYMIDRRLHRTPWVTITLITACTVIYVATFGQEDVVAQSLGFRFAPSGLYTWFTSMFLHADPTHLIGNMFFLWLMGSVVEDALGHWRYLTIYAAGGLVSALLHGAISAGYVPAHAAMPLVGASGALAAIMGVFAVRFYRTKVRFAYFVLLFFRPYYGTVGIASAWAIGLWFAQQVLSGFLLIGGSLSVVASWAHIGGLLCGVSIALWSGYAERAATEYLAEDASQWSPKVAGAIVADKYAELAERDPDNPEWRLQQARGALNANPPDQTTVADALAIAITLLLRQEQAEAALDVYAEMGANLPQLQLDAHSLIALGGHAESTDRLQPAAGIYETVLQQWPDTLSAEKAQFRLAHVYLKMGLERDAHETWRAFMTDNPDSEWVLFADKALTTEPG